MNPSVLEFFREFFQRFFIKSPKFFRIFQFITGSLTFAAYIPSMLQRWFNVEVPGNYITMCEDIAKYSTGFFVSAVLTAETKPAAIMKDGDVLKKTDEKRLPFTKMCEEKEKEKLKEIPKVAEVVAIRKDEASNAVPPEEKKDQ